MNKETLIHLWTRKKRLLKFGQYMKAREIDELILARIRGKNDKSRRC